MIGQASNPMLAQAEEGIVAKVPQQLQSGLQKVINAGMTIMYSPKLAQEREQKIAASKDPAKDAGEGAARMVANLYQQSGKRMPVELVVPAAMIFGLEWLDLVAKAGRADVTPDLIADAVESVGNNVLPLFRMPDGQPLDKNKLAQLIEQAKAGAQNQAAPQSGIIAGAQGGM